MLLPATTCLFWQWLRAKAVQRVLQERFPKERVWCTHAIVVWAKLHGYTPVSHPAEEGIEDVPSGPTAQRTYSEPVAIMDWLVANHKSDQCSGAESDDEVDVVRVQSLQTKGELNDVMSFSKYDSSCRWNTISDRSSCLIAYPTCCQETVFY
jgi:hypothetical protein